MTEGREYRRPEPAAQEALQLLDHRGEFAMVSFLMGRVDPDAEGGDWLTGGVCALDDGSVVYHQELSYAFEWQDNGEVVREQRGAVMTATGRPAPSRERTPLVREPTVEDVWSRFMQNLEEQDDLALDEPTMSRAESYALAPDLHGLIRHHSEDGRHDAHMDKYHSFALASSAADVARDLPEAQMAEIRRQIRERARSARPERTA